MTSQTGEPHENKTSRPPAAESFYPSYIKQSKRDRKVIADTKWIDRHHKKAVSRARTYMKYFIVFYVVPLVLLFVALYHFGMLHILG